MLAIVRRSSFFYVTHFLTYVMMSLVETVAGRRGIAVFIVSMAFIWLPSSVLWSERNESYTFLRLLPVRDRDVVRAKLLLGLGA
ncbi:MAG: ABC-2 transporter permease, partial [Acidobacteria bacterium]|nr:ABC-2 transporter permease [Acidobacteriota bacterium]